MNFSWSNLDQSFLKTSRFSTLPEWGDRKRQNCGEKLRFFFGKLRWFFFWELCSIFEKLCPFFKKLRSFLRNSVLPFMELCSFLGNSGLYFWETPFYFEKLLSCFEKLGWVFGQVIWTFRAIVDLIFFQNEKKRRISEQKTEKRMKEKRYPLAASRVRTCAGRTH